MATWPSTENVVTWPPSEKVASWPPLEKVATWPDAFQWPPGQMRFSGHPLKKWSAGHPLKKWSAGHPLKKWPAALSCRRWPACGFFLDAAIHLTYTKYKLQFLVVSRPFLEAVAGSPLCQGPAGHFSKAEKIIPFFRSFVMPSASEMRFKKKTIILKVSLGAQKYSTNFETAVVCQFWEYNQGSSRFYGFELSASEPHSESPFS